MRKVIYPALADETKKLMIYESADGVYLFGYDSLLDSSCLWDNWFESIEDADDYCKETYNVEKEDWIAISDPIQNCQHDFIMPTKVKGKEIDKPEWGHFQTLINGNWIDIELADKYLSFGGLTGNERLIVSGLLSEFDKARINDKTKATKILRALQFDNQSIEQLI